MSNSRLMRKNGVSKMLFANDNQKLATTREGEKFVYIRSIARTIFVLPQRRNRTQEIAVTFSLFGAMVATAFLLLVIVLCMLQSKGVIDMGFWFM